MMARLENSFLNGRAVDKGAIGRTEVFEDGPGTADRDFAVRSGDGSVRDLEVVFFAAPDAVDSMLELDFPSLRRSGVDQEPICHGYRFRR